MFCWVSALLSPPSTRVDRRGLVCGHARAAAKCHVLQRVRRAGKAVRRLVAAGEHVQFHRDDRRQRIVHQHHAQGRWAAWRA